MTTDPQTDRDWADCLAAHLADALDALDPDGDDPEFRPHRGDLALYQMDRLESEGQIKLFQAEDA